MSHPDDETLTAVLDGETGPEERAHVEDCHDCGARLEWLRQAAALVATPVEALDELRREATIRQALAVFDGRRASRPRPPAWAWTAVAAAAVVVVVAIALGQSGDGGRDDNRVAAAPESAGDVDTEAFATGAGSGSGTDDGGTDAVQSAPVADELAANAPPGDLGELRDADLAEVLRPHLEARQEQLEEGAGPCDSEARRDLTEGAELVFTGSATYDGQPVSVLVFEAPDGNRVARVLDEGCGLVLSLEV